MLLCQQVWQLIESRKHAWSSTRSVDQAMQSSAWKHVLQSAASELIICRCISPVADAGWRASFNTVLTAADFEVKHNIQGR